MHLSCLGFSVRPSRLRSELEDYIIGNPGLVFSEGKTDTWFTWTCKFVRDYETVFSVLHFSALQFVICVCENIPVSHNSDESMGKHLNF